MFLCFYIIFTVILVLKNCKLLVLAKSSHAFSESVLEELESVYGSKQKAVNYSGNPFYKFDFGSRHYLNNLAVFYGADKTHMHGLLGTTSKGEKVFKAAAPFSINVTEEEKNEIMRKGGGFFGNFSDTVPLDRVTPDRASTVCRKSLESFNDLSNFEDVSIVVILHNEVLSILLRTLHSILNFTPPALLRELLIIDDFSTNENLIPGSLLYDYVKYLPKAKIMRLPERKGLVQTRLTGIQLATAPIVVVLDSHVEVENGWLEPLVARIKESPESIVFSQIYSIDPFNFDFHSNSGIGCYLSFNLKMIEASRYVERFPESAEALKSPMLAGGVFAARRDWFWKIGGFDEEFSIWGSENVEFGFRIWRCGGKLECLPCSSVYHIFRNTKSYRVKPNSVIRNSLRTAMLWTEEFVDTLKIVWEKVDDVGSFTEMNKVKSRLKCKSLEWYMRNVLDSPDGYEDFLQTAVLFEIRNKGNTNYCIDSLSHSKKGESIGIYSCHKQFGTQSFFYNDGLHKLSLLNHDNRCITNKFLLSTCAVESYWYLETDQIKWKPNNTNNQAAISCLSLSAGTLKLENCDRNNLQQFWLITGRLLVKKIEK